MAKINQVRFSRAVKFFEKEMCHRWHVTPYVSRHQPCLFAGVYNMDDVRVINAHRAFKVVWSNGVIRPHLFRRLKSNNLVVCQYTDAIDHSMLNGRFKIKKARFEIKDYSMFRPTPLGDSICVYLGSETRKAIYAADQVEALKEITDRPIIYSWAKKLSRPELIEQVYNKCFVHFKPALIGGAETANELALMGRHTVSNGKGEFYLPYGDLEEAAQIIEVQAANIGKTVDSVLPDDYFNVGRKWMDINFWKQ